MTLFRGIPRASKYVRKNGATEYMFRTRGIPILTFVRSTPERWNPRLNARRATRKKRRLPDLDVVFARARHRHWIRVVEVLEAHLGFVLDHVRVLLAGDVPLAVQLLERVFALHRALLTGEAGDVAARAPVGREGVDEGTGAMVRTEMADRGFVVDRGVLQVDGLLHSNECGFAISTYDAPSLHGRADGSGLSAVGMHDDAHIGYPSLDVVDLGFDRGHVPLGSTLEHEHLAELREARDVDHVLPDVLRQHLGEPGQHLGRGEPLLLEVDPIGVEEHRAAVAELRRQIGGRTPYLHTR